MSILSNTIKKSTPSAPKGIIYGPPGIGKTTFGAGAKGSIIIDCENGAGAIPGAERSPYLEDWDSIKEWLTAIEKDDHKYEVMVVDSIDWLVRRVEESVIGCKDKLDMTLNKSHGGYGNGKSVFRNYIYQLVLPTFDRIVNRGVAVVLLAHAERHDITETDGVTMEKSAPDLPKDHLNVFVEWSDFVFLAQIGENGERELLTRDEPHAVAKNRYHLPRTIPFTWGGFMSALSASMKNRKQQEQQQPAEPATA